MGGGGYKCKIYICIKGYYGGFDNLGRKLFFDETVNGLEHRLNFVDVGSAVVLKGVADLTFCGPGPLHGGVGA